MQIKESNFENTLCLNQGNIKGAKGTMLPIFYVFISPILLNSAPIIFLSQHSKANISFPDGLHTVSFLHPISPSSDSKTAFLNI